MHWRTILIGSIAVVIVLGAPAAGLFVLIAPTFKQPPSANMPTPRDQAEANRQDLRYLKRLPEIDRSFTPTSKAAFETAVDELLRRAGTLDRAALEMGVARAVALAGNGHTNEIGVAKGYDLDSVPLRFCWFKEGLFVVAADHSLAELVGAKVVRESGRTPEELTKSLDSYIGGTASFKKAAMPFLLESPAALHAAGLSPSATATSFTFLRRDGRQVDRTIAANPESVGGTYKLNKARIDSQRYLSPIRISGDDRRWMHVLDGRELPLYLRRPNQFYWSAYLDNQAALYVQINACRNQDGSLGNGRDTASNLSTGTAQPSVTLEAFLDGVLKEAAIKKPRYVIVDLRFNSGGNSQLANSFARHLPGLILANGRVFIATSGNTFSAGLITAAWLKYYSGNRGDIVGEPMGDSEQFWAEGYDMVLPNSQIVVEYATALHDWKNGCAWTQLGQCFFMNYVTGVAAGSLSPTISVQQSFADYEAGRDTIMKAIEDHAGLSR